MGVAFPFASSLISCCSLFESTMRRFAIRIDQQSAWRLDLGERFCLIAFDPYDPVHLDIADVDRARTVNCDSFRWTIDPTTRNWLPALAVANLPVNPLALPALIR